MSKLGGCQSWDRGQFRADVKARWKTGVGGQPKGADVKAEQILKLGGRQCRADIKESWGDMKAGRKKQLGRRKSWADVKAGQKTMLGGCQRKMGGCQSWAEVKGDQKIKLITTSPQVNLRRCMCISEIHCILPFSCGPIFPFLKSGGQRCSKLSGRQDRTQEKAGRMSKLGRCQCWGRRQLMLGRRRGWADVKESWTDVKAGRKKQLGRRQSWVDVKAGRKTMVGGCQRKLGGCQSWAEVTGDQKLKLIKTSPQVNLGRCMCVSGIHCILPCSCGLLFLFLKSGGQRSSKLSGRQDRAEYKAGQMSKLGGCQC
jgi:predicted Fe-S protein YdhL (DUF1289 family)